MSWFPPIGISIRTGVELCSIGYGSALASGGRKGSATVGLMGGSVSEVWCKTGGGNSCNSSGVLGTDGGD